MKPSGKLPTEHVLLVSLQDTYGDYSLEGIPDAAKPDRTKKNRGEHSYTVTTAVSVGGVEAEVIVDVLLRAQAYYIKRSPGGTGQVGWRKNGGPVNAWAVTLARAAEGQTRGA